MPSPFEIIDDVTPFVDGSRKVFTVRKRPYIAGSVHVYVNGLLMEQTNEDGWIELDPDAGTVELKETPIIHATHPFPKTAIHIVYQTFEQPFDNPLEPRHITDIAQGDVLKIAMRPGFHLESLGRRGGELRMESPEIGKAPRRGSSGGFRTVFWAFVNRNQPLQGFMDVAIQDARVRRGEHYLAIVKYRNILYIYRQLTDVQPIVETAPVTHPGAKALGTRLKPRQFTLVPVLF